MLRLSFFLILLAGCSPKPSSLEKAHQSCKAQGISPATMAHHLCMMKEEGVLVPLKDDER